MPSRLSSCLPLILQNFKIIEKIPSRPVYVCRPPPALLFSSPPHDLLAGTATIRRKSEVLRGRQLNLDKLKFSVRRFEQINLSAALGLSQQPSSVEIRKNLAVRLSFLCISSHSNILLLLFTGQLFSRHNLTNSCFFPEKSYYLVAFKNFFEGLD